MKERWERYLEVSGRHDPDEYINGLHSVAYVALEHYEPSMAIAQKRMVAAHTLIMAVMFIGVEYEGSLEGVLERVQPHADNICRLFWFEPEWLHMHAYIKGHFFNRGEDWIVNAEGVIRGRDDLLASLIREGLVTDVPALAAAQRAAAG